jgi:HPt (histidine-containing phosphotransfer) domain-containing protein
MTESGPELSKGAADAAVLDPQALAALQRLDPSGQAKLLTRVFDTYRASLARLLTQLDDAQRRADAAGMRLAVHTLKSSSASVGALDLSRLCADAERALREGRLDALATGLERLRTEARRVDLAAARLLAAG